MITTHATTARPALTEANQRARLRVLNAALYVPAVATLVAAVAAYALVSPDAGAWVAAGGIAWLVLSLCVQLLLAAPLARWIDGE